MSRNPAKAHRDVIGDSLHIRLSGEIDDQTKLSEVIGPVPKELRVHCRDVPRINSTGVDEWIRYFNKLAADSVKIVFLECSPAIVEQFNLIKNFHCGGKIESVYVPFLCPACKKQSMSLFTTEQLKKIWNALPTGECPRCHKAQVEFDDFPADYFTFLKY